MRYEDEVIIRTDLATWKHSNGDSRAGTIIKKSYTDPLGNELLYEVCRFTFDRVELLGELEVMIKGENSLEIVASNGDLIVATPLDISGGPGGDSDRGKGGAGGWAGGDINVRVWDLGWSARS